MLPDEHELVFPPLCVLERAGRRSDVTSAMSAVEAVRVSLLPRSFTSRQRHGALMVHTYVKQADGAVEPVVSNVLDCSGQLMQSEE